MSAPEIWGLVLAILHVVIGFTAAIVISLHRKPATAIAWILTIIFIPFLGAIVFFLIGFGRLPRRRREQQREVNRLMLERSGIETHRVTPESPAWLTSAAVLNQNLGALPMVGGNTAALIENYVESLDQMIIDIDAAESFVHVEFYILVRDHTTGAFFDALARATARGVRVRVLSDHVSGFMFPGRRDTLAALAEMGAEWRAMLPLRPHRGQWQRPDLRNHRKLVVIDGRVGYTGSQNLIDDTYLKPGNVKRGLHWIELMVRLEGPIVGELDAVFVTDWLGESGEMLPLTSAPVSARHHVATPVSAPSGVPATGLDAQVVPSGPSFENDNNLKLFVLLIQSARSRISITSPYFVPDESTLLAIVTAASRGVEVELFVSEVADQVLVYHAQRSYYAALLAAGVSIYLYRAPTVLHSKHFSIDDEVAVIGSSNMDIRSFSLNMEVSVLVRGREFVDRMRLVEDAYRAQSVKLDAEAWPRRPLPQRVGDALARLTSALQ
ncbi:cardiolipin synthase [Mycetocola tolaasinivorans]|uniref:Cardiolipin synthase n=1 Tax=Mycetocola tolaasinivorans TaxID=76635 RepID=A0A3L7AC04_9MICO|nr:cardiolipin synthase [Mycetocola tolaasinivorans]RLP77535.1 cardiolipin synthase [Mycetocola tolaasinivorans]